MIRILETAEDDLVAGYRFYEDRESGAGNYFLESLLAEIDSLKRYAGIHRTFHGKFRMLSRKFPFAIYYTTRDGVIEVHAILDLRRHPSWIRKRIGPG